MPRPTHLLSKANTPERESQMRQRKECLSRAMCTKHKYYACVREKSHNIDGEEDDGWNIGTKPNLSEMCNAFYSHEDYFC